MRLSQFLRQPHKLFRQTDAAVLLGKHDRPGTGDDHAVFKVGANRPGKYAAFDIPAPLFEISRGAFVGDGFDILFNDGSFVQIFCGIMGGGADHFHAAFPGPAVGIAAHECREESVVDVDDL